MTAEFNWWLLLLGLVVGGGLTWLVLADTRRREQDLEDDELAEEAAWLEVRMAEEGQPLPADTLERVVRLHRAYLAIEPSDELPAEEWRPVEPATPVPPEASSRTATSSEDERGNPSTESSWRPPA